jgi:protein-S-isoprenylcysteine O-methyltransferase Ste14
MFAFAAVLTLGLTGPPWAARFADPLLIAGATVATLGGVLGSFAIRALGSSLTPLPHPREDAVLRTHGVYARCRHPIYGALLLVSLGWSLLTSPWAVIPWLALFAILLAKSTREEAWLTDRFEAYAAYRARVRRRFVPFVL